mgnify:CR=1 FL=1
MNTIKLRPIITVEEKNTFVSEIQEAFQISYVSEFGEFEKQVLPTEDIEESFNAKGAEAYIAEIGGERIGGAVIVIDDKTGYNSLHLLYVKSSAQNAGNGFNPHGVPSFKKKEKLSIQIQIKYKISIHNNFRASRKFLLSPSNPHNHYLIQTKSSQRQPEKRTDTLYL